MLTVVSLALCACSKDVVITPSVLTENEEACYQFAKTYMLKDGGMITNYHKKLHNEELATGNEILSESQGLLLNYTASISDKAVFDEVYKFTKKHLDNGKIFVYRYNPDISNDKEYNINAAVDDLRIIKGLFNGGNAFSDKKLIKEAEAYSKRFYKSNIENDRMYDFYDTELYMKNDFITLCYLDLEAIKMISSVDKRYEAVYDNSLEILEGGYISDDFPMFMTRYDYTKGKYITPKGVNMVESVLTALNLSYAGKCPDTTIAFLKKELEKGKIYARYELDGKVKDTFESTAIYALCAILAKEIGDDDMYNASINHMTKFMITKNNDPLYGAFGDDENVYSFDNLMALTALRKGMEQ